jgi:tRNA modification GTPase
MNGGAPVLAVSAKTGEGLPALMECVKAAVSEGKGGAAEAQWLLNLRHRQALERAQEALQGALAAAASGGFEECVALELKSALQALGEIVGETSTEELLGQIFSQFCVGK